MISNSKQSQVKQAIRRSLQRVQQLVQADTLLQVMKEDPTSSKFIDSRVNQIYEAVFNSETQRLIAHLTQEVQKLTQIRMASLKEHEAVQQNFKNKLASLTRQNQQLCFRLKTYQEKSYLRPNRSQEQLADRFREAELKYQRVQTQNAKLVDQIRNLRRNLTQKSLSYSYIEEDQSRRIKQELENIGRELERSRLQNHELRLQLRTREQRSPRFGGEEELVQQSLRKEQAQKAILQKQLHKLREEQRKVLDQTLDNHNSQKQIIIKQNSGKIDQLKKRNYQLELQLYEAQQRTKAETDELRVVMAEYSDDKQEMEFKLKKLQDQNSQLVIKLTVTSKLKQNIQSEIAKLKNYNELIQRHSEELQQKLDSLKDDKEKIRSRIQELSYENKTLKELNVKMEMQKLKDNSQISRLKVSMAGTQEKLKREKERYSQERTKLKQVQKRLDLCQAQKNAAESQFKEKIRQLEKAHKVLLQSIDEEKETLKLKQIRQLRTNRQKNIDVLIQDSQAKRTQDILLREELAKIKQLVEKQQVQLEEHKQDQFDLRRQLQQNSKELQESQKQSAKKDQTILLIRQEKNQLSKEMSKKEMIQKRMYLAFKDQLWNSVSQIMRTLRQQLQAVKSQVVEMSKRMGVLMVGVRTDIANKIDVVTSIRVFEKERFYVQRQKLDRLAMQEKERQIRLVVQNQYKNTVISLQSKSAQLLFSNQELTNRLELTQIENNQQLEALDREKRRSKELEELFSQTQVKLSYLEKNLQSRSQIIQELEVQNSQLKDDLLKVSGKSKESEKQLKKQIESMRQLYHSQNQNIWNIYEKDINKLIKMAGGQAYDQSLLQARRSMLAGSRPGRGSSLVELDNQIEMQKNRLKGYRN